MSLDYGIHDNVPAETYHADPCEQPSLSASIANILVSASPAHARAAHPRLNPDLERDDDQKFDVGTAVHDLFLRGVNSVTIIDAPDWRSAAAKDAREQARADGRIPLLADQFKRVNHLSTAIVEQLARHDAQPPLFDAGKPEQTLVWQDDHGVVCRARLDWLRDDYTAVDDLKTTSASADPAKWARTMYGIGADVQVAFYMRGVYNLAGVVPSFRYVVCETYPPYALAVVDLAPSAIALARDKVQKAIDLWASCLDSDSWPAYDRRVSSIELPTFEEMRWLERQDVAA